ncbi:MAG: hypothetical protein PUC33_06105 [Oscillospiraceae bacterium]|nr:hypothetical protein [Oscillospiraceae bacterium]
MKTLLKTQVLLGKKDEKTNMIFPFSLEKPAEKLTVDFSYSPKILQDPKAAKEKIEDCLRRDAGDYAAEYPSWETYLELKNLVTVSLDDPEGYRGCAHRHSPRQHHEIGESSASPGFLPGKIEAGPWRLVLHVHAVVTQECFCEIEIQAGDSDE